MKRLCCYHMSTFLVSWTVWIHFSDFLIGTWRIWNAAVHSLMSMVAKSCSPYEPVSKKQLFEGCLEQNEFCRPLSCSIFKDSLNSSVSTSLMVRFRLTKTNRFLITSVVFIWNTNTNKQLIVANNHYKTITERQKILCRMHRN